jgi:hypothetical protein
MMDDPDTHQFLQLLGELRPAQRAAINIFGLQTKADPFTAAYTLAAALGYGDSHATRCAKEWQSLQVPKTSAGVATPAASRPSPRESPRAVYDYREPLTEQATDEDDHDAR